VYGELAPGQVRVANEFVSVDPYMRGRMNAAESYIPPFVLGETMTGTAVGRVVESAAPELPVGTAVLHMYGWRDIVQEDAAGFAQEGVGGFKALPEIPGVPLSLHLGVFGMTGMTAYVGLTEIAAVKPGDTVFVSGAAGAVGTIAGQIAKLLGADRVIGSAGTPEKVRLLTEKYGYDAAFNYKDAPVREQLGALVPDGVDVFFDNVGGDHLEAALDVMNRGGRIAMCGAIAGYNATERVPGPDNLFRIVQQGVTARGFTMTDYMHHAPEFGARMTEWFGAGKIAYDETIVDGVENAVDAFLDMMRGKNTGKMVVRV
jgi:NADPH-dependent curcumin reductase CurA